jgi:hypothetical protein
LYIAYEGVLKVGGAEVVRRLARVLIAEQEPARPLTFLSYAREDQPFVSRLKGALQNEGLTVWLDQEEILPGESQVHAIERAIAASKAVVVVFSDAGLRSQWVRTEYDLAVSLANKPGSQLRLVPILVGTAREEELPGFAKTHSWVDFRDVDRFEENVAAVVFGIKS